MEAPKSLGSTSILVVEDEVIVASELNLYLNRMGYRNIVTASSGEEALELAYRQSFDLALMDIRLPGRIDGIETAGLLRINHGLPVVFVTSYDDDLERAKSIRPFGYVLKPINYREIRISVEMALFLAGVEARRLSAEEALQRSRVELEKRVEARTEQLSRANAKLREEVKERGRAEEALRRSQSILRSVLESPKEISIYSLDRSYRFTAFNHNHETLMRQLWGRDIAIGTDFLSLISDPKVRRRQQSHFDRVLKGENFQITETNLMPDGRSRYSENYYSTILDEQGKVQGLTVYMTDITGRKQAEASLAESEEKFRLISEQSFLGLALIQDGVKRYVNQAYADLFGRSLEEMTAMSVDEDIMNIHGDDRDAVQLEWDQRMKGKKGVREQSTYRIITSQGKIRWVEQYARSTMFENQPALLSALVDITDRVETEAALLKQEKELKLQAKKLEEANVGLKVLIQHRDDEKMAMRDHMLNTLDKLVLPFVAKLKNTRLDGEQEAYVEIVAANLAEVTSPLASKLSSRLVGLTPTELEVATLIKGGKTNDEIGELLHISDNSVKFHRKNIRAKLGLKQKKINLRSYLSQFS